MIKIECRGPNSRRGGKDESKMSKAKSHKKISALDVVRWLLLLVALVAAVLLVKRLLEYKMGQDTYKDIASQFTAPVSAEANVGSALLQVDLEGMRRQNPDVIGWIQIDSLDLSYPVLKGPDNAYYLHRLPDGGYNASGSLFMDANNTGFEDLHSIVYGHNMRDGSMFKDIVYYKEQEYFDEHSDIYIYTPDREIHLKALGALYTTPDGIRRKTQFDTAEEFDAYVEEMTKDVITSAEPVNPVTRLYSLITCSYEFADARTILYAYEVTEGEEGSQENIGGRSGTAAEHAGEEEVEGPVTEADDGGTEGEGGSRVIIQEP